MSPQDVARGVEDDSAVINFNAFRMRRVMPQDEVGAGIDEVVRKSAVIRADVVFPVGRPMYRNQDVVDLRPQTANVLLDQERIHGDDPGATRCRECGLAEVGELRIADEAELDAVALEDHGLSRVRKIAAAPDMGNARGVENAQGIQEPPLFCVECMVVGQVYDAYPG